MAKRVRVLVVPVTSNVIDICAAARVHRMPEADDIGHKRIRWIGCICSPALGPLEDSTSLPPGLEWLNLHTAEDLYALVWSRDDETLPVKIKSMRAWLRIHGGGWDWINRIFELKERT